MSLESNLELVEKWKDTPPLVLFTKNIMYAYKPIPVGNIPPLRFVGVPKNQLSTSNMHGYWQPEIFMAVVT